MNQRPNGSRAHAPWVNAAEATRRLGVKRATLYAYASRGLVRSVPGGGGRRERLYDASDIDRLRTRSDARRGHAPVAAGALLWGDPVLETRVGDIRASGPHYRGVAAAELARRDAPFEEVCALLWDGTFVRGPARPGLGVSVAGARACLSSGASPFDGILVVAAALAATQPRVEGSLDRAREGAGLLVRRLFAAAGLSRRIARGALREPDLARSALVALGGQASPRGAAAMREALVLAADHELNASTFAARVAAGAGASIASSVLAALAVLSGPLHGGVTMRVEALVRDVDRPPRAAAFVAGRIARAEDVPGFGHPLYPEGDPRGARLLELAASISGRARSVRVLQAVSEAMRRATGQRPTLDVGLVALAGALGLDDGAALGIFAMGRLGGWIAHVLEQRASGLLLRPRARYVGQ